MAHRLSYEVFVGPIPQGMDMLHRCDTPLCINFAHLFPGTQSDNIEDCRRKGRLPLGERRPEHKLTSGQAQEIYNRVISGEALADLGREFGVRWQSIQAIRNGRSWAHATGAVRK